MKRVQQMKFDHFKDEKIKEFGGSLLKKSHAKKARPISVKKSMHVVLKSSRATGSRSLKRQSRKIDRTVNLQGCKHGVKVYKVGNGGDHLHLVLKPMSRRAFNAFIRSITGLIARIITGRQRGAGAGGSAFWEQRPYSKIIEWGRQFRWTMSYLMKNDLQTFGFLDYRQEPPTRLSG